LRRGGDAVGRIPWGGGAGRGTEEGRLSIRASVPCECFLEGPGRRGARFTHSRAAGGPPQCETRYSLEVGMARPKLPRLPGLAEGQKLDLSASEMASERRVLARMPRGRGIVGSGGRAVDYRTGIPGRGKISYRRLANPRSCQRLGAKKGNPAHEHRPPASDSKLTTGLWFGRAQHNNWTRRDAQQRRCRDASILGVEVAAGNRRQRTGTDVTGVCDRLEVLTRQGGAAGGRSSPDAGLP